ncbi:hypothetical protein [Streptomyces sp. NPDC001135]
MTDTPPATGDRYYYAVTAVDRVVNRSAATTSLVSEDYTAPTAPTGLTVAVNQSRDLDFTWQPSPAQ